MRRDRQKKDVVSSFVCIIDRPTDQPTIPPPNQLMNGQINTIIDVQGCTIILVCQSLLDEIPISLKKSYHLIICSYHLIKMFPQHPNTLRNNCICIMVYMGDQHLASFGTAIFFVSTFYKITATLCHFWNSYPNCFFWGGSCLVVCRSYIKI